jgi:NAD(P)-dependent dehydrogenase (short-subunit alcohol dehydrogenase family)
MNAKPKVVVITGASQGIGAGLVEGFLSRGYRVVANSRRIEPSASPDGLTIAGDVAAPETAGRIVGAAIDQFGRIDCSSAVMLAPRDIPDGPPWRSPVPRGGRLRGLVR